MGKNVLDPIVALLIVCGLLLFVLSGCAIPKQTDPKPAGVATCEAFLDEDTVRMMTQMHNYASCLNRLQWQKLRRFKL